MEVRAQQAGARETEGTLGTTKSTARDHPPTKCTVLQGYSGLVAFHVIPRRQSVCAQVGTTNMPKIGFQR
jgi:hypothetical protein